MAQKSKKRKKASKGIFKTLFGGGISGDISLSFFAYVMILLVVGIVMMSSASYAWAYSEMDGDGLYYARRQLINAGIGFVALIFCMKFDYHNFKNIKIPLIKKFNIAGLLYLLGLALLIIVLFMGTDEGGSMGAKRWLVIAGQNFQPSEIAKLTLIIFFAYSMEKDGDKMKTTKTGLLKYGALFGVYGFLLYEEPHVSGLILIGCITVSMILCGGANVKKYIPIVLIVAVLGYIWISKQAKIEGSYIATRFKSWRDPFADVLNETWQTANSLIAIGSGGVFGLGLGNSRQKYLYLPETQNDFVFPIVCEELGFVGAVAVMLVFLLLVIEGYSIAARCKDKFGMLIAVGITTQIGIQTIFNLAVVSNLVPNTGISLPFFSYGGTALIMQMAEMGIMLNISQNKYYPEPVPVQPDVPDNGDYDDGYVPDERQNA
jgi:cell division protein FtsW